MSERRLKAGAHPGGLSLKERVEEAMKILIDEARFHGSESIGMLVARERGGWVVMVSGCGSWQRWFYGDKDHIKVESNPCATAPNTKPGAPASPEHDAVQNPERGNETQDLPGTHM